MWKLKARIKSKLPTAFFRDLLVSINWTNTVLICSLTWEKQKAGVNSHDLLIDVGRAESWCEQPWFVHWCGESREPVCSAPVHSLSWREQRASVHSPKAVLHSSHQMLLIISHRKLRTSVNQPPAFESDSWSAQWDKAFSNAVFGAWLSCLGFEMEKVFWWTYLES